jgi:hypothetical protein
MLRALLILVMAAAPAVSQNSFVRLINSSRPASSEFQVGDRFEIAIAGPANQPVSVRTTRQGRTDWGPVIGSTDWSGRWSITGRFEKEDFGGWSEAWTVGGKLVNPVLNFSIGAPCLNSGQGFAAISGLAVAKSCSTAEGLQTYVTPSETDSFRTPDGRVISGRVRSTETAEQYRAEIMQSRITDRSMPSGSDYPGDAEATLILKVIGVNALSEDETRNALAMIHAAFEESDRIPPDARFPRESLRLLQRLSDSISRESLKNQIAETVAYVQAR